MKYPIVAAILLPLALSSTLALAHGSRMMGGMMRHGLQGCMPMMQGMHGGGEASPNEQWRRGQADPSGEKRAPEPRDRLFPK